MKNKNDGGPAFPHEIVGDLGQTREVCEGISVRDYFAAKAMQALMGNNAVIVQFASASKKEGRTAKEILAALSYETADAMLMEREK